MLLLRSSFAQVNQQSVSGTGGLETSQRIKRLMKPLHEQGVLFFAYGAKGAFQGQLNPLSGRAIFESCVLPVLMYGSENWYVTDSLMAKLEAFQEEIGRRILRLPRHHSGRGVRLALEWPSMVARVLQRKVLYCCERSTVKSPSVTFS